MKKSQAKSYWAKKNKWFIDAYNKSAFESIKHAPVLLREDLAVLTAKMLNAKTILDLGCGPCRVLANCLEAIEDSKGIGLDFSQSMIEESKDFLKSKKLISRAKLKNVDLLESKSYPKADLSIGLGLFDYISNPKNILDKSIKSSPVLVASWPTKTPRNYLRKFRYSCNVHTYKKEDILTLLKETGFKYVKSINLGGLSGFVTISSL